MKATDNTVFVRFTPPSSDVNRWHLEEFFSQIGPIKKCSVIASKEKGGLGYGFVKFVSQRDAEAAAKQCNDALLNVNSIKYRLKVSLASTQSQSHGQQESKSEEGNGVSKIASKQVSVGHTTNQDAELDHPEATHQKATLTVDQQTEVMAKRKRTSRVIVRNLSFYADEKHVRAVLEKEFGPVVELTLPRVNENLHRGFCFATFESAAHARTATEPRATPLTIKKRAVAIDFAVAKVTHQKMKETKDDSDNDEEYLKEDDDENIDETKSSMKEEEQNTEDDDDDDQSDVDGKEDTQDSESDADADDEQKDDRNKREKKPRHEVPEVDEGVLQRKTVFIRNLPFDTTRNDIFQLLRKFGHIESVYPVMDKETGIFKGTAFCSFRDSEASNRALEAASSSGDFQTQRDLQVEGNGLHVRGRRIFIDLAVDKQTASTLTLEKTDGIKSTGKDRRCLYLASEGYVASQSADDSRPNSQAWESLPESDQLKRQRALTEKTTKLKSPLFFINPARLSIRNVAKHVDEVALKELCVKAVRSGLNKNLVKLEDQVAYWRADGGLTARDVMNKINEAKSSENESIIPEFNDQNVKKYIPSVYVDRDFSANKKEKGISRGFGFVDFTHHAHALACLREMNNNPSYSADYVVNGKKASVTKLSMKRKKKGLSSDEANDSDRIRIPRLIVEFTVENKAKAKQQVTNRAKQQANIETQKMERESTKMEEKKEKKKKHRGALQREKKRKQRDGGGDVDTHEEPEDIPKVAEQKKAHEEKVENTVKPPKKPKIDAEDRTFEALVRTYSDNFKKTASLSKDEDEQTRVRVAERRWFE